ncbi:MAG: protoporphyrinogen oxidase [Candidatus Dadabacteria bacterium]|nr:protoporphyrinogen oxidase [Candidatus Dadabacteria bacterium]
MKIIVIGGGITGLAATHRLIELSKENDLNIKIELIESSPRVGGNISTLKKDDLLIEEGPDSFITSKPYALNVCKRLDLEKELISTRDSNRRTLIYLNKSLIELPEGFILLSPTRILPFITSPVLSLKGKLRALMELVIPKNSGIEDESLESFVTRRFGKEMFENIAQPLIGGIYTSDPYKLSIKSAMPNIHNLEHKYGSIIKGLINLYGGQKESGARYSQFVTLKDGMRQLVESMTSKIPKTQINTSQKVKQILKPRKKWKVETENGDKFSADGVILATPSYISANILSSYDPSLSSELSKIEFASSAIVILVYKKKDIKNKIDGFGFVVPAKENLNVIACSFSSEKFPSRAPNDTVLLRCFVGGALNESFLKNDDKEIIDTVKEELKTILHINSEPQLAHLKRYPNSMPQYNVGHSEILSNLEKLKSNHPSLQLAGNSYEGVGIPDCIRSGEIAAENIIKQLK